MSSSPPAKRRRLIVGNWKMNGRLTAGVTLAKELAERAGAARPLPFDLVLCPPATLLWPIAETVMGSPLLLGGQNCHAANHGAYTGEISAGMLADLGCRYVILGHSERRAQQGETSEVVAGKVAGAQMAGLIPIVCVGETKAQREAGATDSVIAAQVKESLPPGFKPAQLVIAYEPVWAIGTGEVPDPATIARVHRLIRQTLGKTGETVNILYGGSVTSANAADFLAEPEVDGLLVGGASLNGDGFWAIAGKCF